MGIFLTFFCVLSVILTVFLCLMPRYQMYLNKKFAVDEKLLEEGAKAADQYEIAYLRGDRTETYHLAFYTLVKAGYLIKTEVVAKGYPPRAYKTAKEKDLSLLHEVEKTVLISYETNTFLPEHKKDYPLVAGLIDQWEAKFKSLSLRTSPSKLWHNLVNITITDIIINFIIIIPNIIYSRGLKMFFGIWPLIFLTIFEIIVLAAIFRKTENGIIKWQNQNRYNKLFEKIHSPYPNFKEKSFLGYLEMITPCSLG